MKERVLEKRDLERVKWKALVAAPLHIREISEPILATDLGLQESRARFQ